MSPMFLFMLKRKAHEVGQVSCFVIRATDSDTARKMAALHATKVGGGEEWLHVLQSDCNNLGCYEGKQEIVLAARHVEPS